MPAKFKIELTKKQADRLHNVHCEIYQLTAHHSEWLTKRVKKVLAEIDAAIKPILDPIHKAEDARREALQKLTEPLEQLGEGVWSTDNEPSDTITGAANDCVFVLYDDVVGEAVVQRQAVCGNQGSCPTFGEAFLAFHKLIELSGDHHHVFFEGVSVSDDGKEVMISTGS